MLSQVREKSGAVLVIDAGNTLARATFLPEPELWQSQLKAELIAQALVTSGIDAMAVGATDMVFGLEFLRTLTERHHLPYVAANLNDASGQPVFPAYLIKELAGYRIAVIGVSPEEIRVEGVQITPPQEAVTRAMASLKQEKVDLVILVSALGWGPSEDVVKAVPGIDLVVVSGTRRQSDPPMSVEQALLMEAGSRGKSVGILEIAPRQGVRGWINRGEDATREKRIARFRDRVAEIERQAASAPDDRSRARFERQLEFYRKQVAELEATQTTAAKEGNEFAHRFEHLEKALPDDPAVDALVQSTKRRIEAGPGADTGAAAVQASTPPADDPRLAGLTGAALLARRAELGLKVYGNFAGDAACAGCHPAETAQWKGTPHARAWATLLKENRSQDFECYGCHVTGHGKEAGPASPSDVGYLTNVQCESCHGAAADHAANPAARKPPAKVAEATCLECHTFEKTGARFDYATYLPKVVHGSAAH